MNEPFQPLSEPDFHLLHTLEAVCRKADNPLGLPLAFDYLAALQNASANAAVYEHGDLVAAAWLTLRDETLHLRAYVHPDRWPLWPSLFAWAVSQTNAQNFAVTEIILHSEFDTPIIHDCAVESGFELYFAEEVMQRDLTSALPDVALSENISLQMWSETSAPLFYAAYCDAFSTRRDANTAPPPQDEWIDETSEEDTFRADLSSVALVDEQPVSYILSDTFIGAIPWRKDESGINGGWISQVGTIPVWRGQGLTSVLMVKAMRAMASEGRDYAGLHVNIDNVNALRLYEKLGFIKVGRRARYRRML